MSDPYETYSAKATAAITVLQEYYKWEQGLYYNNFDQLWWQSATALESVIDYMQLNNSSEYSTVVETTFALNQSDGFINDYYDDEGWWAITWIKAFDLTGDEKYLEMAKSIFSDLEKGWNDAVCGGGLWWKKPAEYKAAIQNELFLVVAARLCQRAGNDAERKFYLDWAKKEWDWFRNSGMINTDNLVNNGLDASCKNDGGTTWTYNQGVILGGLVELYRITKDESLLAAARAIADAAIVALSSSPGGILQEPCERGDQTCNGDAESFKGIFVRYLSYLYAHLPVQDRRRDDYKRFLILNADSAWTNDRSETNQFDLRWTGTFKKVSVPTQTAALDLFNAVLRCLSKP